MMPKYIVEAMPNQISAEVIDLMEKAETATVGHWRHWGFMDRGIQSLLKGKRVAGTAVTLAIPGPDSTLLHHALGLLRPGDILVVDRLGDDRHACWGGGVTVAAKAAGAAAGIVDGPCTDQLEIEQSDFPLWCRGLAPITTRLYNLGGILNGLIACGGVPVQPGDAILADESGVLVLPPDEVDAVATAAIARQERGETNQERMRGGAKLGDLSGASRMVAEALKAK